MKKNIRWRLLIIAAVTALAVWAVYPPEKRIRLGLDLKGGVQLVMRVQTNEALRLETETTVERIRETLQQRGINVTNLATTGDDSFVAEGVAPNQDADFRRVTDDEAGTVYNRNPGANGRYTFAMKPNIAQQRREEAVTQALQTVERRVNELGVSEPSIARHGESGDQLLVQLPGVTDVARAKEIIRSTALLELKLVEAGPSSSKEDLLKAHNGKEPPDMQIVPGSLDRSEGGAGDTVYYLVRRVPVVTGRDLRSARPTLDENNQPAVSFSLNRDGARRFGQATGSNIGRQLAIILDGRVQSAPRIENRITDEGRIHGSFTTQQVQDLSLVLKSGALPASLTYLQEQVVGPTLGRDSIRSGVVASVVGLALVIFFMLFYYRLSGINAVVALIFNLVILLGLMAYLGATMTLPGIAGFVLTMGIGVDSNVLIFERIKEELHAGKGVRAAIDAGFGRVFLTLVDTHVASLISAAFLFQFGTGPIRGFATTLTIGLVSNLFTSIFVSRTIFEMILSGRQVARLSI
jgi:preprotein translocase subunit SecD